MKIPSLAYIKKELTQRNEPELVDLVLQLSKLSRDNKAFVYFKLFEADNNDLYLAMVKEDLEEAFENANLKSYFTAKKSAQSIRRMMNKSLKLTKDKVTIIELLFFFCEKIIEFGYLKFRHPVIDNLYASQVKKIEKLIAGLHEDLQFDYQETLHNFKKHIR
ncbi:hypothetical protein [Cyclobacterium qasimii]|uniref:Uncharacterized protein n=1 Tax=Cyclobacterium qasimii TaxID=1350429 RepID=A0A512C770_9BACT|nr:hypothetical protein [Cyclobacterium qasimii]GEO20056.1 hypothetical protein CQA01_05900 [Cyclobacterium qasimii]